jgi:hypothetical protein
MVDAAALLVKRDNMVRILWQRMFCFPLDTHSCYHVTSLGVLDRQSFIYGNDPVSAQAGIDKRKWSISLGSAKRSALLPV